MDFDRHHYVIGDFTQLSRPRTQRRRMERALRRLMDSERCSFCHKPFAHNGRTYGGLTANGVVAISSDCCKSRIARLVISGFFLTSGREYDILRSGGKTDFRPVSVAEANEAIEYFRAEVARSDQAMVEVARVVGPVMSKVPLHTKPTPWKQDDAQWFASHPHRAHRVRNWFPGEGPSEFDKVVVRQVRPGLRVRRGLPFIDGLAAIIDRGEHEEAVAHALFDLSQNGWPDRIEDVLAMIGHYQTRGVM